MGVGFSQTKMSGRSTHEPSQCSVFSYDGPEIVPLFTSFVVSFMLLLREFTPEQDVGMWKVDSYACGHICPPCSSSGPRHGALDMGCGSTDGYPCPR